MPLHNCGVKISLQETVVFFHQKPFPLQMSRLFLVQRFAFGKRSFIPVDFRGQKKK